MTDIEKISEWLGSGSINIFGLPYAGKDTQGRKLAEALGATRLSGGEILRGSVIPPHVKEAIDAGNLAPTDEYIEIILPYLSKKEFANKPLVLSAVGRWEGEEEGIMRALEAADHDLKVVILLQIDESVVRDRWRVAQDIGDRGERDDDQEHLLDTRIQEFNTKTMPVIEHYEKLGLLERVHGMETKEQTFEAIIRHLIERIGA